jgi:antibiotic biosynthesis monooxygenase (ABM) superfamily enzyme
MMWANDTRGQGANDMWAQMISMKVKPGKEEDLPRVYDGLRATERPGSGLIRSTACRDQNDPSRVYHLVIFESEEKARAREQDPERQKDLEPVRALMADIFEGPPEFVDLVVMEDDVY